MLNVRATSSMGYFDEARARAKRRRSPWNLLLVPTVMGTWVLIWYTSARALGQVVRRVRPELQFVLLPDSFGGVLMAIGLLVAWLPLAMVVGNLLVAAIPAAKRVLDREAKAVPGTDVVSSNRGLLRVARVLTPGGLVVALLGAWIS